MAHIHHLTDSQKRLVEENMGLVGSIVKKTPVYLFDSWEDAFQTGSIGLVKAARSFDPNRQILFRTYAAHCIENELRMAMRHSSRAGARARICSLDAPADDGEENSLPLSELLADGSPLPEEICMARETLGAVLQFLKKTQDDEARIILDMVARRRSQAEIARAIGCTQPAVSRKLRRIRAALREAVGA